MSRPADTPLAAIEEQDHIPNGTIKVQGENDDKAYPSASAKGPVPPAAAMRLEVATASTEARSQAFRPSPPINQHVEPFSTPDHLESDSVLQIPASQGLSQDGPQVDVQPEKALDKSNHDLPGLGSLNADQMISSDIVDACTRYLSDLTRQFVYTRALSLMTIPAL